MNNPGICCYERELRKSVKGFRRRKRIVEAFRNSLSLFLEEVYDPTYDDLEEAFGPPKQMAEELVESIPNLPSALRTGQKVGIAVGFCLVAVVVCIGAFYSQNMPETKVTVLEGNLSPEEMIASDYTFGLVDMPFNSSDVSWEQKKKDKGYVIFFENKNQVETNISVKYSGHQPSHTLVVPAGGERALQVEDACSTEHTISFSTSDGSLDGRVWVIFYS